jgi:hypothetical protein
MLRRFSLRFFAVLAGGHFAIVHALFGLWFMSSADSLPFKAIPPVLQILMLPAELISPLTEKYLWQLPPRMAIPIGFASLAWSSVLSGVYALARRYTRRSVDGTLFRWSVFAILAVLLVWLFFGPVFELQGQRVLGTLDAGRLSLDGAISFSPGLTILSSLFCMLSLFAAYKLVIRRSQPHIDRTA